MPSLTVLEKPEPTEVTAQLPSVKVPQTTQNALSEKHATLEPPQPVLKDHSLKPLPAHQPLPPHAKLLDAATPWLMVSDKPEPTEVTAQLPSEKEPQTTQNALSEKHATLEPPQPVLKDHSLKPSLAHQLPPSHALLPDAAMLWLTVSEKPEPTEVTAQLPSVKVPQTTQNAHSEKHAMPVPPQLAPKDHSLKPSLAHQPLPSHAMPPDAAMLWLTVSDKPEPTKETAQVPSPKRRMTPQTTQNAHSEKHATPEPPHHALKDHSLKPSPAHQPLPLHAKLLDAATPWLMVSDKPEPTEVTAHEHPDRLEASLRQWF